MLGLTLGICLAFTGLSFLLVYVIEDQIFVNVLRNEQEQFEKIPVSQIEFWKPASRYMDIVFRKTDLPNTLRPLSLKERGIHEFYHQNNAYFVLYSQREDNQQLYYITYNVSALLAVKGSRSILLITIAAVSFFLFIMAVFVAIRLSRKTLQPLKKLTDQLQDEDGQKLSAGFAEKFAGDEIGILATQLELAIKRAQKATQREFEFNSGVSHELRSPIQVAQNSVELMILDQTNSNSRPLQRLKRSISQMKQVTEAFLWLASQRTLEKSNSQGKQVLENLVANYKQSHPLRPITVQFEGSPEFLIPQPVLTVIIDNLLRNAIQHSSEGEIFCKISQKSIAVQNPVSETPDLNNGFGIGLTIVKRICERLGWQLVFSSCKDKGVVTEIVFHEKLNNVC